MGAVFEPKDISRKPRKKVTHDSIKDIVPETNYTQEDKWIWANSLIVYLLLTIVKKHNQWSKDFFKLFTYVEMCNYLIPKINANISLT